MMGLTRRGSVRASKISKQIFLVQQFPFVLDLAGKKVLAMHGTVVVFQSGVLLGKLSFSSGAMHCAQPRKFAVVGLYVPVPAGVRR